MILHVAVAVHVVDFAAGFDEAGEEGHEGEEGDDGSHCLGLGWSFALVQTFACGKAHRERFWRDVECIHRWHRTILRICLDEGV